MYILVFIAFAIWALISWETFAGYFVFCVFFSVCVTAIWTSWIMLKKVLDESQ